MKNIQTGFLKIIAVIVLAFVSTGVPAQGLSPLLQKADSLFSKKQFTQSFEIYQRIHKEGQYTPAMFLKMAFIQEGLNKPGLALYYLNLYYLASNDNQALVKMEEVAAKNHLNGYEYSQLVRTQELFIQYRPHIAGIIVLFIVLLMALAVYQSLKGSRPVATLVFTVIGLILLGLFVNFSDPPRTGIITGNNTIVMNGPSAGASVVGLLNEGSKIQINGHKDVWLKINGFNYPAYVKQTQVKEIAL